MIDVVCWLWKPALEYRSQFSPKYVNILRNMIERHYPHPFRFNCITDDVAQGGFDERVRLIPLWDDFRKRQSLYGPNTPSCYPRLRAFDKKTMLEFVGPRFVSIDLDVVITGNLSDIFHRKEDFVIWGATHRRTPYNGSMWMMNAGARQQVWDRFEQDPERVIARARGNGFYGSDQAVMNYVLGPEQAKWAEMDGVYSYRMHIKNDKGLLPANAKVVFFEGHYDPWNPVTQSIAPWIKDHYF